MKFDLGEIKFGVIEVLTFIQKYNIEKCKPILGQDKLLLILKCGFPHFSYVENHKITMWKTT